MVKFCRKLQLFGFVLLVLVALIIANPTVSFAQAKVLVDPPCATSTCISFDMIDVAKNKDFLFVDFDKVPALIKELAHFKPCKDAAPTGVTVHKQVPFNIEKFPDSLCTNQGCSPVDGVKCN